MPSFLGIFTQNVTKNATWKAFTTKHRMWRATNLHQARRSFIYAEGDAGDI